MNIRQLEIDLDNAWWGHGDVKYEVKVATTKAMGYKVYRNSEGKHKVKPDNTGESFFGTDGLEYLNSLFGGNK